jgi:CRISPR-associated protein Cmr3
MHTYLIEPKAPLVVRSGRPFDEQAGADAARFPPPSTLAGALRAAHAESVGKVFGPELANIPVAGPLPVKLDADGNPVGLLVPKPADALYLEDKMDNKKRSRLVRAAPEALASGEGCDLPAGLLTVQLTEAIEGKPATGPRWWAWEDLLAWRSSVTPTAEFERQVERNGWSPPADEIRTHVAIQRQSQAAESGRLFQTAGLSFWQRPVQGEPFPSGRLGLLGRIAGEIDAGLLTLGGERRLSALRAVDAAHWPGLPANLIDNIRRAGGLSLTLLTPALFTNGWHPELDGLQLRAAALDRWQPHSGWDLAEQQPRAGRKLVSAGAVYWFELGTDTSNDLLASLWLSAISDDHQDRRDGFGLALPQPWHPVQHKN